MQVLQLVISEQFAQSLIPPAEVVVYWVDAVQSVQVLEPAVPVGPFPKAHCVQALLVEDVK